MVCMGFWQTFWIGHTHDLPGSVNSLHSVQLAKHSHHLQEWATAPPRSSRRSWLLVMSWGPSGCRLPPLRRKASTPGRIGPSCVCWTVGPFGRPHPHVPCLLVVCRIASFVSCESRDSQRIKTLFVLACRPRLCVCLAHFISLPPWASLCLSATQPCCRQNQR